jgi:hypothetical protein
MADIDAIEGLLCQRYNVRSLGEGELTDAIARARAGELQPLCNALAVRDLYHWHEAIHAALAAPSVEPETAGDGIDGMTVAELRAHAEENGIDLAGATRKADIIAAIQGQPEAEEEQPEGDNQSSVEPTT